MTPAQLSYQDLLPDLLKRGWQDPVEKSGDSWINPWRCISDLKTPLEFMVSQGDLQGVRKILALHEKGIEVGIKDAWFKIIQAPAICPRVEDALELNNLYTTTQFNFKSTDARSALVVLFKNAGIDVDFDARGGRPTLLIQALRRDQQELCKTLLELGADPNYKTWTGKETVLGSLLSYHRPNQGNIKLLLQAGLDLNLEANQPWVEKACQVFPHLIPEYLNHGMDPNYAGDPGDPNVVSPLFWLIENRRKGRHGLSALAMHEEVASVLLNQGAQTTQMVDGVSIAGHNEMLENPIESIRAFVLRTALEERIDASSVNPEPTVVPVLRKSRL